MGSISGKLRAAPTRRLALTPGLRRSLDLLRMDAADLVRMLEDEAAANPWLVLSWPMAQTGTMPEPEAPGPGLHAHVLLWIDRQLPHGEDRRLALALAEALEPTGWLGEPPDHIAARAGVPTGALLNVLARLQRIEPAGLFARDLAECLRLQAQSAGVLDAGMLAVLARLDLLARGGAPAVARATGVSAAKVAVAVSRLRGFDPKPGLAFETAPVPGSRRQVPDLVARRKPDGTWHAEVNPRALPLMAVRPAAAPDNADVRNAATLIAQVARRNRTLLTLADAVLAVQGASLDHGPRALRPLTRAAIAEATGLAASTVGRALHRVRILTPQGLQEMSGFFSAALGADASAGQAQAALRRLIATEDHGAPLTDAALATELAALGIAVSRRTVAKYRDALGLPSAHQRRKRHGS